MGDLSEHLLRYHDVSSSGICTLGETQGYRSTIKSGNSAIFVGVLSVCLSGAGERKGERQVER